MKGFILTYSLVIGLLLYSFGVWGTNSKSEANSNFESGNELCSEEIFCYHGNPYINSKDLGPEQVFNLINPGNPVHYTLITQNREQSFALSQKSYRTHKGYATHLKI